MDQATPGDAWSRAEGLRPGPTGSSRAGDSRAGMLAEPEGARARNAWGPTAGRARPAPTGGLNRSKGQNVQVSLRLSVCGTQKNLGRQPALLLGEPGRRRPAGRTAPRVRTFKFRSVCQSVELRMISGLQPAQAGSQDDDSRLARGVIF